MTQLVPSWFALWQTINSFFGLAVDAAMVFPFMLSLGLLLLRSRQRAAVALASDRYATLGMLMSLIAFVTLLFRFLVELRFLPASVPAMTTLPFDITAPAWRQMVTTLALWTTGTILLFVSFLLSRPVLRAVASNPDAQLASGRVRALASIAGLAFLCFFVTAITRLWPFLGLPPEMTQEHVFSVLLKNAWHSACAALMPAGAFAVLSFFLSPPRKITGNTSDIADMLCTEGEMALLRMHAAFAIAGAVFQLLDAGFLAFSYTAAMGIGLKSVLMQYGPFFVTGISLACWGFLFARPRRDALFLALLPFLLILLKAGFRL